MVRYHRLDGSAYAPALCGGGNPDDALVGISFAHQRLQYEITQLVPLAVLLAIGVLFYVLGRATREQVVEVPLAAAPGAAASPLGCRLERSPRPEQTACPPSCTCYSLSLSAAA
jgi:hypothetical protein